MDENSVDPYQLTSSSQLIWFCTFINMVCSFFKVSHIVCMVVSIAIIARSPASGVDPGFLERGFICIKVWGVRFADFVSSFLNIP